MNGQNQPVQTENNRPRPLAAPKICHNPHCSFQTNERLSRCPKCGRPIWTANEFRVISSFIIPCGLLFCAVGGWLLFYCFSSGVINFQSVDAKQIFLLALFGSILALGLSVTATGVWQVIFARANLGLIYILFTAFAAVLAIAVIARFLFALMSS